MGNLALIEQLTEAHAQARSSLEDKIQNLEDQRLALLRRYLRGLKSASAKVAETHANLKAAIEAEPAQFEKPRTRVFSGIKIGLQKTKGSLSFDKKAVIPAIKKKLPDQADILIQKEEKPVSKALNQLAAGDLKKIGVTVVPGVDQVVIKPVDSDIDKLISAWLSDLSELEIQS
ncbi:MAG: hypothetical protein JMN25_17310 [gamma proteobacterium endosymbiont of Lamellibrachia anaximandri]|nr:hypothetical protein [gamma proteobacterium endosymbiont of Lamellibrachia anaximandri]